MGCAGRSYGWGRVDTLRGSLGVILSPAKPETSIFSEALQAFWKLLQKAAKSLDLSGTRARLHNDHMPVHDVNC